MVWHKGHRLAYHYARNLVEDMLLKHTGASRLRPEFISDSICLEVETATIFPFTRDLMVTMIGMERLTGQYPTMMIAGRSANEFQIVKDQPYGARCKLYGLKAFEALDRLDEFIIVNSDLMWQKQDKSKYSILIPAIDLGLAWDSKETGLGIRLCDLKVTLSGTNLVFPYPNVNNSIPIPDPEAPPIIDIHDYLRKGYKQVSQTNNNNATN